MESGLLRLRLYRERIWVTMMLYWYPYKAQSPSALAMDLPELQHRRLSHACIIVILTDTPDERRQE